MRQRRIAGRYELLEQVGGSSWRAADTELEREVLVQMPARDVGVARLTHPSIVQVFDQGEENGESYAVLEYVPGGSLERRLEAGPLGEDEAGRIAADVTAAVAYAHAQGVTHGSLDPASVLLTAEGQAKVAGFGADGTPEDDERALAALVQILGANATATDDADVTAVLQPVPAVSRRPIALIALAALVLLVAGVGAAFLATSGGSSSDGGTGSVSIPASTGSTQGDTQEPVIVPPATTSEKTTTEARTTAPTTSVAPPATTEPPPPTEPPGATVPPAATEPPPTTEPPPATTEPRPDHGAAASDRRDDRGSDGDDRLKSNAEGGNRTHTPRGEPDFESGASASSATSARPRMVLPSSAALWFRGRRPAWPAGRPGAACALQSAKVC